MPYDYTGPPVTERTRRIMMTVALAGFGLLLYFTVYHFIVALIWAAILVLTTWPLHRKIRRKWPKRTTSAALLMTFFLTIVILVPLTFVGVILWDEATQLEQAFKEMVRKDEDTLAEKARSLPWVGEDLGRILKEMKEDPQGPVQWLVRQNESVIKEQSQKLLGRVSDGLFTFFVCMFATYFLFKYGEVLAQQIVAGVERLGGQRLRGLTQHIEETVKAVVYGLVMTAIAQAIVSAIGFSIFGVPYPLLLGIMMFFVSFIPFGPPLIWVPASLILLTIKEDNWWNAGLMFVYGATVISTMDNIFRPLFIGQATRMSILLVFMGIIGGILSFGMVGLFVGPVVIAIMLALWKDWVANRPGPGEKTGEPPLPFEPVPE